MRLKYFSQGDETNSLKARYLFIGAWNTFFGLAFFFLLLKVFSEINYSILLICSFLISTAQSHQMQRRIVWKSKGNYLKELLKFLVGTSGTFIINFLTLPVLVEVFRLPIYLSQIILVIFLTCISYFYQKNHVFPLTS